MASDDFCDPYEPAQAFFARVGHLHTQKGLGALLFVEALLLRNALPRLRDVNLDVDFSGAGCASCDLKR